MLTFYFIVAAITFVAGLLVMGRDYDGSLVGSCLTAIGFGLAWPILLMGVVILFVFAWVMRLAD